VPKVRRPVSRYGIHIPANIDVKASQTRLNMTQEEFAGRFGFSINALPHWEQGRRLPEGPPSPICWSSTASEGCPKSVGAARAQTAFAPTPLRTSMSAPILTIAAALLFFQLLDAMPLVGFDLAEQRNIPVEGQVGY
jgi:transcriptional regulator with XRE-family HTH domain